VLFLPAAAAVVTHYLIQDANECLLQRKTMGIQNVHFKSQKYFRNGLILEIVCTG
jgi:hypothetical protein